MFQAFSQIKTSVLGFFGLTATPKVEKVNGNGHHVNGTKGHQAPVPVTSPVAESDDADFQVQSPALGLDAVVAQAAAAQPAVDPADDAMSVDPLFVGGHNEALEVLASAMASSGFEAPAAATAAPTADIVPPEVQQAADVLKERVEGAIAQMQPTKPTPKVDNRPRCKVLVCEEPFEAPLGYTGGCCKACDPDGWKAVEARKANNAASPAAIVVPAIVPGMTKTAKKKAKQAAKEATAQAAALAALPKPALPARVCTDCRNDFVPAEERFTTCPGCHQQRINRAKQRQQNISASISERLAASGKEAAEIKARLAAAHAAEQQRMEAEGFPQCKGTCKEFFEPAYAGAEFCRKCWKQHLRMQDENKQAAEAEKKRFTDLADLFRDGKDMPKGVTYTRSGTQLTFVIVTGNKSDGTPIKASINGHLELTPREVAEAEARKAEAEAAKRKADAERAEAERVAKALAEFKKKLGQQYLDGSLPEGVTAEIVTLPGEGKKAEAKTKVRFTFADGTKPLEIDPPTKEEPKKKGKGEDKKKGKKK